MKTFNYNRAEIKAGIVHFGVGNFHRAHLEAYTNLLLEDPSQRCWGVFGAMIMPTDGVLFNALKKDDGIYQLTTCSPSGEQDSMLIGSLVELAWGEIDSEPIIAKLASEEIKIISLTITIISFESRNIHVTDTSLRQVYSLFFVYEINQFRTVHSRCICQIIIMVE